MTTHQKQCDDRTIELFLSDGLSIDDEQAFERHLSTCDNCCSTLREKTAEVDWWNDARSYLSTADLIDDRSRQSDRDPDSTADSSARSRSRSASHVQTAAATIEQLTRSFLAPTDDPRMLGRFAGYEITGIIGHGGMGIVLKGLDPALNRYTAIKVLAPHFATSGAARQRFAREARAAAAVVHDNVIAIHGVNEAGTLPYLIMPYVRGESLQTRLERDGALALPEILRIASQTAAGLAAAHEQGLVHRDIKPANILLPDGVERVMITDFGLARTVDDASLTRSGVIAGTPQFMSPEQARGDAVDARSDLFSLGSVIYAMCTGRPPFRAETSYGILRRITDTEPRPIREINAEIPHWLCRIVERLHARSKDDRLASAEEVSSQLNECLAHVQNPDRPLPDFIQAGETGTRSTHAMTLVGVVVALVVGCITLAVIQPWNPTPLSEQVQSTTSVMPGGSLEPAVEAESGESRQQVAPTTAQGKSTSEIEFYWGDGLDQSIDRIDADIQRLNRESERAFIDPPHFESPY